MTKDISVMSLFLSLERYKVNYQNLEMLKKKIKKGGGRERQMKVLCVTDR